MITAIGSVCLLGCGGGGGIDKELVGGWVITEENGQELDRISFFDDGIGVMADMNVKWKVRGDRLIIIQAWGPYEEFGQFKYKVSGHELTLVNPEDKSFMRCVRKEKFEEDLKIRRKQEAEKKIREEEAKRKKEEDRKNEREKKFESLSDYFIDSRDEQKYRTVTIGGKTWMADNLNYDAGGLASWCYENDDSKCMKYGRLYVWIAAKAVCPSGWHLPSAGEWDVLVTATGGDVAGKILKSSTGEWDDRGEVDAYGLTIVGGGTDVYGFSALPGGRSRPDQSFYGDGSLGFWWTETYAADNHARCRLMSNIDDKVNNTYNIHVSSGLSVRCVQDVRQ